MDECKVAGCYRQAKKRGWCLMHYDRWLNTGDPGPPHKLRIIGDDRARFWSKVVKTAPSGCWNWIGTTTHSYRDEGAAKWTYGAFSVTKDGQTRHYRAHRYAYELLVSPIPTGAHLDHLCRNTLCVNPSHLEPVSNAENSARGMAARINRERQLAKTHCKRGHSFDKANTHWYTSPAGKTQRVCRACKREKASEQRQHKL